MCILKLFEIIDSCWHHLQSGAFQISNTKIYLPSGDWTTTDQNIAYSMTLLESLVLNRKLLYYNPRVLLTSPQLILQLQSRDLRVQNVLHDWAQVTATPISWFCQYERRSCFNSFEKDNLHKRVWERSEIDKEEEQTQRRGRRQFIYFRSNLFIDKRKKSTKCNSDKFKEQLF